MSDVIDTNSNLFKLYAARRVRKGGCWNVEDVIDNDKDTINICSYVRNIIIQVGFRCMINLAKFIGGLLASFLILTPLLTVGFWLGTDNGFIVWFGAAGIGFMFLDYVILAFVSVILTCVGWMTVAGAIHNRWSNSENANDPSGPMKTINVATTWIKSTHGKFCVKLKFDRKSTNSAEQDHISDWPHV